MDVVLKIVELEGEARITRSFLSFGVFTLEGER